MAQRNVETIVFTPALLTPELLKRNIDMEKKKYIAPEIEVIELESQVLMFSGSLNGTEVDTEADQLTNGYRPNRRGKWGDLWYVEEY